VMSKNQVQRQPDTSQNDDCIVSDASRPVLNELMLPSCKPTDLEVCSVQGDTTTPKDMFVERRVRSVDDIDDYMKARARLLALSRRPTQLLNEIHSSRSRDSGGKKGNTQVYSLQVRRAKCKQCHNVGHTPILQLHLVPGDQCIQGSSRASLRRQQQHQVLCCVCNKIITTAQIFRGSKYEI